MSSHLDRLEPSNLRAHYEDLVASTLRSMVRHVSLIIALIVVALALAGLVIWNYPRKYTAEALVHPKLFYLGAEATNQTPLASIEGASLVASDAHLIRSPAMIRTVVNHLRLDEDPEFGLEADLDSTSSAFLRALDWLRTAFLPETAVTSPRENAAARVRQRLNVTNEARSYLISISFAAGSPEKAAKVANAFALEYARAKTVDRLGDAVTAANRELARQSAIYGERHPSISQAKTQLEVARSRLQAAINRPEMPSGETVPSDGIILADPNPTPSSPKGSMILGLTLIASTIFGIGLAVCLDRWSADYWRALLFSADARRSDGQDAPSRDRSEAGGERTGSESLAMVPVNDLQEDRTRIGSI